MRLLMSTRSCYPSVSVLDLHVGETSPMAQDSQLSFCCILLYPMHIATQKQA